MRDNEPFTHPGDDYTNAKKKKKKKKKKRLNEVHGDNYREVGWLSHLVEIGRPSFELSGHDEHGLEGAQPEVVVVLFGQLLLGQFVEHRHLLGQHLGEREQM